MKSYQEKLRTTFNAFSFTIVLQTFTFIVLNVLASPSLLILPFSRVLSRKYMIICSKQWGHFIAILTNYFAPVDFVFTGDFEELKNSESVVLTANHQMYTDWWYLWLVSWISGSHGKLKIIAKKSASYIPIIGLAMWFLDFISMKRKWSLDKLNYTKNLTRTMKDKLPLWLIIFPEGTVICDETKTKSDDYAKKMGWKEENPKFVLWPKHTGLYHACDLLKNDIPDMFDLTISFSGMDEKTIPYDFYTLTNVLFANKGPKKVFIHVRRFQIKTLPGFDEKANSLTDEDRSEAFGKWLRSRYQEKSNMIQKFHKSGKLIESSDSKIDAVMVPIKPTWWDYLTVIVSTFLGVQLTRVYWSLLLFCFSLLSPTIQYYVAVGVSVTVYSVGIAMLVAFWSLVFGFF